MNWSVKHSVETGLKLSNFNDTFYTFNDNTKDEKNDSNGDKVI